MRMSKIVSSASCHCLGKSPTRTGVTRRQRTGSRPPLGGARSGCRASPRRYAAPRRRRPLGVASYPEGRAGGPGLMLRQPAPPVPCDRTGPVWGPAADLGLVRMRLRTGHALAPAGLARTEGTRGGSGRHACHLPVYRRWICHVLEFREASGSFGTCVSEGARARTVLTPAGDYRHSASIPWSLIPREEVKGSTNPSVS